MTHRGPFQPRTFCDSVILIHQLRPSIPAAVDAFRNNIYFCLIYFLCLQHFSAPAAPAQQRYRVQVWVIPSLTSTEAFLTAARLRQEAASTLGPRQCLNPWKRGVRPYPPPGTSPGRSPWHRQSSALAGRPGLGLPSHPVPAPSLPPAPVSDGDAGGSGSWWFCFLHSPLLNPPGPLSAGLARDGTRPGAPKPRLRGFRVLPAGLRRIARRVLYARSFDKNKSSCLQFALNYIKVSAGLTAPSEKRPQPVPANCSRESPGSRPRREAAAGPSPGRGDPVCPQPPPAPAPNCHGYRDACFSPICTRRSVTQ